jgi:REP element-mobilizing transposase RayT
VPDTIPDTHPSQGGKMRPKRVFLEEMFCHVTSRTNNKIRCFEDDQSKEMMVRTLFEAKVKFQFYLTNFCIMPTHIHLLIKPMQNTKLSEIMQWLKTMSAKRWNKDMKSSDHLWGNRYFCRIIKNEQDYEEIMHYIDHNPVTAGLVSLPEEWKESASFYKHYGLHTGLID